MASPFIFVHLPISGSYTHVNSMALFSHLKLSSFPLKLSPTKGSPSKMNFKEELMFPPLVKILPTFQLFKKSDSLEEMIENITKLNQNNYHCNNINSILSEMLF